MQSANINLLKARLFCTNCDFRNQVFFPTLHFFSVFWQIWSFFSGLQLFSKSHQNTIKNCNPIGYFDLDICTGRLSLTQTANNFVSFFNCQSRFWFSNWIDNSCTFSDISLLFLLAQVRYGSLSLPKSFPMSAQLKFTRLWNQTRRYCLRGGVEGVWINNFKDGLCNIEIILEQR